MKKILLAVMLVLVSTSAAAEWTAIGNGRDFQAAYYLDFNTINKQGQNVKVWELMDFNMPQELNGAAEKYLSSTLQLEFDCDKRQGRILSFLMYAGKMASKEIVYSANFPAAPWKPVPPDSVTKELWNSACGKM